MKVQYLTLFAAILFAPALVQTATAEPSLQELVCQAGNGDPAAQCLWTILTLTSITVTAMFRKIHYIACKAKFRGIIITFISSLMCLSTSFSKEIELNIDFDSREEAESFFRIFHPVMKKLFDEDIKVTEKKHNRLENEDSIYNLADIDKDENSKSYVYTRTNYVIEFSDKISRAEFESIVYTAYSYWTLTSALYSKENGEYIKKLPNIRIPDIKDGINEKLVMILYHWNMGDLLDYVKFAGYRDRPVRYEYPAKTFKGERNYIVLYDQSSGSTPDVPDLIYSYVGDHELEEVYVPLFEKPNRDSWMYASFYEYRGSKRVINYRETEEEPIFVLSLPTNALIFSFSSNGLGSQEESCISECWGDSLQRSVRDFIFYMKELEE